MYTRAPNSSAFNHIRKWQRVSLQHGSTSTHTPSIHVHFPNPNSPPQLSITTSQSPPIPAIQSTSVATTPAQPAPTPGPVIDLTGETESNIIYPTVSELLAELDESMPALSFTRYEEQLLAAGFRHVHQLVDSPTARTTLADLGVLVGIVDEIIERAQRMTRRAVKSKSTIKDEDDTNHGI